MTLASLEVQRDEVFTGREFLFFLIEIRFNKTFHIDIVNIPTVT
jgi:hypothetical protein